MNDIIKNTFKDQWYKNKPATAIEISAENQLFNLPKDYQNFIKWSNGGKDTLVKIIWICGKPRITPVIAGLGIK